MPLLQAEVRAEQTVEVVAGEFAITITFANVGDSAAQLNTHQASHPALVLDVRNGRDEQVLLPPPSAPDAQDLEPGRIIVPGEDVSISYVGFLDRSLAPGTYRVRYFAEYPALGGSVDDPLISEWLQFSVRPARGFTPGERIPGLHKPTVSGPPPGPRPLLLSIIELIRRLFRRWLCRAVCLITRILGNKRCGQVLSQEFDEPRTETISNAPPGSEAWNGTYGWRARFQLTTNDDDCRATATIRVRLVGAISNAQRSAWEAAIESVWNDRFKGCSEGCWCCCVAGCELRFDVQFVTSGEHQVVNVGASTTNMGNWGAGDTVDIGHEFGHMLGALDEYFTVNGTNWGAGRQPGGAIMNNPANPPVARHYETVRAATSSVLSQGLKTVALTDPCP